MKESWSDAGAERSTSYDVAVVGAGPAGSTMAAALADLGWKVLLLERDEFPRHKVCGEFISPESQLVLHQLGLHDEIAALQPAPLQATRIVSRFARELQRPLPGEAWGLSRYALDAGLAAAAVGRGVELRTSTTVTRCRQTGHEVTLHLRQRGASTSVSARTTIMAYGRSPLPGLTAGARDSRAGKMRYVGVKSHYTNINATNTETNTETNNHKIHNGKIDNDRAKQVELYFFRGGYAGLNPVEQGRTNLCLLASYDAFAAAGASIPAILQAAIRNNPALAGRMAGATAVAGTECAVANVDTARPAQPWGVGAHLGDSAVMLPPLCGDGMAMALQSALLCAPLADAYLRGAISLPVWQMRYEQAWRAEFSRRVWLGRKLQTLLQLPVLAELLLMTGSIFPALADYFITSTRGALSAALLSPT